MTAEGLYRKFLNWNIHISGHRIFNILYPIKLPVAAGAFMLMDRATANLVCTICMETPAGRFMGHPEKLTVLFLSLNWKYKHKQKKSWMM